MNRYLIFIFIFFNQILYSQNLVKNGGFEDLIGDCDYCWPIYWHESLNISPDVYNLCNNTFISGCPEPAYLPFSHPFQGKGYIGMPTFSIIGPARKFATGELVSELKKDSVYNLQLAIKAYDECNYLSQKLHVIFQDELVFLGAAYEEHSIGDLPFIEFNNIANTYKYTIGKQWIILNANYKAKGSEKFLTIGNFDYSSENAIFWPMGSSLYQESYFFIDDVQLQVSKALLCDLERGNAITPNGDGLNDVFEVKALYSKTSLYIFNRWGNMIYETNDYRNDWDAKDQPAGVYYYIFRRPNGDECRGVVSVIKDN